MRVLTIDDEREFLRVLRRVSRGHEVEVAESARARGLDVQHGFNQPRSRTSQLRAFDASSDRPSVGLLRMTLAHRPETFGFRLDVGVGDLPDMYLRDDPASTDHPQLSRALSHAEQAFVTAIVPLGQGISVDLGKFGTPIGLEDNEAPTHWNYSRSLLYLLAEPSYRSGVRLTYRRDQSNARSSRRDEQPGS